MSGFPNENGWSVVDIFRNMCKWKNILGVLPVADSVKF